MAQDQTSNPPNGEAGPKSVGGGPSLPLRRSGRMRKRPSSYDEDAEDQDQSPVASPSPATTRRNPKRKAAADVFDVPDNLLEASLGPWKENEQSEWSSWTELESDPAFFTGILGLLGVKGANIEEVLSVDEDSLATLPHPVYGLVFLYEYVPEDTSAAAETSDDLWFANQTTNNACATIALLNIIMNAEGLALGEKLRKFKQESMDLSPPLRGNMISNSDWIRMAHNSFARRIDLLNAALSLQNEVDKKLKKRAKAASAKRKKTKPKSDKKSSVETDSAYHFIAFVPVGQRVWQLDGLKSTPVCIGEYDEGKHWTSVMHPVLQERMMRYETERLSFSLLALCGDSLTPIRRRLAANIRCLEALEAKFNTNPDWAPNPNSDTISSSQDPRLSTYQLDSEDIHTLSNDTNTVPSDAPSSSNEETTAEDGLKLHQTLCTEQQRIRAEYEREQALIGQEPATIFGRTKDHTAGIHEWAQKLVEHGVLRKLHDEVQVLNS